MTKNLFILFILLCVLAIKCEDRRVDKSKLKIATFNLLWFFEPPHRSIPWKTPEMAQMHMENIATVLNQIDADIVNVVEVQSKQRLDKLNQIIPHLNYTTYLIPGTDTATGQNVGLLTRIDPINGKLYRSEERESYPITELQSNCGYSGSSTTGISKHYYAFFNVTMDDDEQMLPLILFGMHLKANPTQPQSCSQREAQTLVARNIMRRLYNESHVHFNQSSVKPIIVTLGDLNDYDNEFADMFNHIPNSRALEILKDKDVLNLSSVWEFIPQEKRYSHWWDKNDNNIIDYELEELSVLDHILFSSGLKVESAHVASDLYPSGNLNISDHWPLVVTLDFKNVQEDDWKEWKQSIIIAVVAFVALFVLSVVVAIVMLVSYIRKRREQRLIAEHMVELEEEEEEEEIESFI